MKHQLSIIIGSTRPGRAGPVYAEWLEKFAREHGGFDPVIHDLAAFDLPLLDEPYHPRLAKYENDHTKAWSKAVNAADAFVFVTPEYNYFTPPAIVNAVDYLLGEWAYKPAGFLSYGGVSGGLRSVQSLKPLLAAVRVMPLPEGVALPMHNNARDEKGAFLPGDHTISSAKTMLDELARWSQALKPMRQAG